MKGIKPRMQRVDAEYLFRAIHTHLTDDEWKELSDKLCTREFEAEVKAKTAHVARIVSQGPSL